MYTFTHAYPTHEHEDASRRVVELFSKEGCVRAVLLTCSCARGKASRDSCLDITILIDRDSPADERRGLETRWAEWAKAEPAFVRLAGVGRYSMVDLEFSDGSFTPGPHGWTTGPDEFELTIGNLLVYCVPLWQRDGSFRTLAAKWLPYYDEALRRERLDMVSRYFHNHIRHIPLYVDRGLYFQSFKRLTNAFGEFLQALFISRRVYPIAYDKWIKEQIAEILGLPDLYPSLPELFQIRSFESPEMIEKSEMLETLFDTYVG
jgi:predicted nucleotidyltransferase